MEFFIVLLIIIAIIAIYIIMTYNGFVSDKNKIKNSWSQIDIELQRRFDLIPNLVESVKGYIDHEEKVFSEITELRTSWASAENINQKAELNNQLSESLKTVIAVAENYPDLKSSENFIQLQEELQNTENKISSSKQLYNTAVTTYNIKLETFPSNIIASNFKFTPEELFKIKDESIKQNIKINF